MFDASPTLECGGPTPLSFDTESTGEQAASQRRRDRQSQSGAAPSKAGRTLPIPRRRRAEIDLALAARRIPTGTVVRRCSAPKLPGLIHGVKPAVSWEAVFLKAYAVNAGRRAELQRCWLPFPRPHLYEHPQCIGRVAIAGRHRGEDWTFFACAASPELRSLDELQADLDRLQTAKSAEIPEFQQQLASSARPAFVRRASLWGALHLSGRRRCEQFGTFAIAAAEPADAVSSHPASVAPITLSYGPVGDTGELLLAITYDARVHRAATAADCLADVERALNGAIAAELSQMLSSHRRRPHEFGTTLAEQRRRAA